MEGACPRLEPLACVGHPQEDGSQPELRSHVADGPFDKPVARLGQGHHQTEPEDEVRDAGERQVELRAGEDEDGPVPQVQAVGPRAHPAQGPAPEGWLEAAAGPAHSDDGNTGHEAEGEEPAPVQARRELGGLHHCPADRHQRRHAREVHAQRDAGSRRPLPQRPGRRGEQGGGGDPDQEPECVGVGAEVDPGGIGAIRQVVLNRDGSHQPRRSAGPRKGERSHLHQPPAGGQVPPEEDQREGPHEVELFLESERPQVLERRRPPAGDEVGLVPDDEPPVRDVAERGDEVSPETRYFLRPEGPDHGSRHEQDHCQGRQQPECPPAVEGTEPDPAGVLQFRDQQ